MNFILHGKLKIIGFFAKKKIQMHMEQVMNEFVSYAKSNKSNKPIYLKNSLILDEQELNYVLQNQFRYHN